MTVKFGLVLSDDLLGLGLVAVDYGIGRLGECGDYPGNGFCESRLVDDRTFPLWIEGKNERP